MSLPGNDEPILDKLESARKSAQGNEGGKFGLNHESGHEEKTFHYGQPKEENHQEPMVHSDRKQDMPESGDLHENKNPLHQPHLQRRQLYYELLNNPDVKKQAALEGRKYWEMADKLTKEFSPEKYGSSLEPYEIKKQLYLDELKIRHQQAQETPSTELYAKLKEERQEKSLLQKIFKPGKNK